MWALLYRNTVQSLSENMPNLEVVEPNENLRDDFSIVYFDHNSETVEVGMDMDSATTTFSYSSPVYVPNRVSKLQAKVALLQSGLMPQIDDILTDSETSDIVKLAWNDASEFRRGSLPINMMAGLLNLTEQEVDNLFILANSIEV